MSELEEVKELCKSVKRDINEPDKVLCHIEKIDQKISLYRLKNNIEEPESKSPANKNDHSFGRFS